MISEDTHGGTGIRVTDESAALANEIDNYLDNLDVDLSIKIRLLNAENFQCATVRHFLRSGRLTKCSICPNTILTDANYFRQHIKSKGHRLVEQNRIFRMY
jgi:Zinc-finger of C2H2 type